MISSERVLNAAIATGNSTQFRPNSGGTSGGLGVSFAASGVVSAATGAATIIVEASLDEGVIWFTVDTLSLTLGTTRVVDFGAVSAPYTLYRMRISAISGTDAAVTGHFAS